MLVERFAENPIIRPSDVKPSRPDYEVVCAFNPAAVRFGDEILLLLRVAERPADKKPGEQIAPIAIPGGTEVEHFRVKDDDPDVFVPDSRSFQYKGKVFLTSLSHLRLARSRDGVHFEVDQKPWVWPNEWYETFGLEDPRITRIGEVYYITYKVVSANAIATALLTTRDFVSFERHGIIFCPENLDVALFPEKIGGKFWALHRPVPRYIGVPTVWLAGSKDGIYWGEHRELFLPREGYFDCAKTGGSCVPFRVDGGWLEIYHGTDDQGHYFLGAALLDANEPWKVLGRSRVPLMSPEADYEVNGFFGNVVFSCGAVDFEDGRVIIYYGAADEYTAGAETTVEKILDTLE